MTNEDRLMILEGAKEAFFKAMMSGYAGDGSQTIKTKTNGEHTTTITFTDGEYEVDDTWHTHPESDKSSGSTLITFRGIPVWWMGYSGSYPKEVIPFLKEALRKAYSKKEFRGGRGPVVSISDKYRYTNSLDHGRDGEFVKFIGTEVIYRHTSIHPVGFHNYSGQSLI